MKITLIRHTSVDVPKGICYGKTDVPLAAIFALEVEKVRQNLGIVKFDAVYSSPLSRCTKLATEILPQSDIQIDPRLTELDFGEWEMTDWNSLYDSDAGKGWFKDYVNTKCPGGESFRNLFDRTKSFLADLNRNSFNHVIVFTHAGIMRAVMCLIANKSPQEAFNTPLEYGQILTFNVE